MNRGWSFVAKRLPQQRYRVECHYPNGEREPLGTTLPGCTRDHLLEWLATHAAPGERLLIDENHGGLS